MIFVIDIFFGKNEKTREQMPWIDGIDKAGKSVALLNATPVLL